MAKINDVQVIEKNTGEKIQWEQDGLPVSASTTTRSASRLPSIRATRPAPSTCAWIAAVILCSAPSPGGRYVAQIEIPAATYTETPIERRKAPTSPAIPTARP